MMKTNDCVRQHLPNKNIVPHPYQVYFNWRGGEIPKMYYVYSIQHISKSRKRKIVAIVNFLHITWQYSFAKAMLIAAIFSTPPFLGTINKTWAAGNTAQLRARKGE